jgi:cyanophycin synthetase
MHQNLKCNVALFSMDEHNENIKRHSENNGLSAIYENGYITICKGTWKMRVVKAIDVPLTVGGKAAFMIQNVLPAVLTGYVRGFDLREIKSALESFIPSPSTTPGRLNIFNFQNFTVLLDYAHNAAGMEALHHFIDKMEGSPKVGIIAGIGDRREEDNEAIGRKAAQMFDEIIIRQDKHLRGRTEEELIAMLMKGISDFDPQKKVTIYKTELEAITEVIKNATPGALITICSDVVTDALKLVTGFKEQESEKLYNISNPVIPNLQ